MTLDAVPVGVRCTWQRGHSATLQLRREAFGLFPDCGRAGNARQNKQVRRQRTIRPQYQPRSLIDLGIKPPFFLAMS